MIRICPKCGDYYADASLAFCLADGTPLVDVNPLSENWREGTRVIEEKENALRKRKRRLKWRRVVLTAMTMLVTTLVVCVVAINSLIYLKPKQEEVVLTEPSTPESAPDEPKQSVIPSPPGEPVPTPDETTLTATPTPTATPRLKDTNTNPKVNTNTNTNTGSNVNTNTHTNVNTNANVNTNVNTHTNVNTNNVNSTTNVNTDFGILPTGCSDADKSRERENIIKRFGDRWRRNIEGERRKIIAENVPAGAQNAEAGLGAIEYRSTFIKACAAGVVTVRYVWQVRMNVNGTIKVVPVAREKKFACVKLGGAWLCS